MRDWDEIKDRFRRLSLTSSHQIGVDDESILITTDEWTIEIFSDSIVIEENEEIPDEIFISDPDIEYNEPGTILIKNSNDDLIKIRIEC